MTKEEKQLLFKDLCARLPYKTICKQVIDGETVDYELSVGALGLLQYDALEIKPYLRPLSSMTEEEEDELNSISQEFGVEWFDAETTEEKYIASAKMQSRSVDFYNSHHFDYRIDPFTGKTLIESNLAIEAPKDMYKTE